MAQMEPKSDSGSGCVLFFASAYAFVKKSTQQGVLYCSPRAYLNRNISSYNKRLFEAHSFTTQCSKIESLTSGAKHVLVIGTLPPLSSHPCDLSLQVLWVFFNNLFENGPVGVIIHINLNSSLCFIFVSWFVYEMFYKYILITFMLYFAGLLGAPVGREEGPLRSQWFSLLSSSPAANWCTQRTSKKIVHL